MDIFKRVIESAARFLDREVGTCDASGLITACSDASKEGQVDQNAGVFAKSSDLKAVIGDKTYIKLDQNYRQAMVSFVAGTDITAANYLELLAGWIGSAMREKNADVECEAFLKNVLLENELPGDIPLKAREYKLAYAKPRQALLIHLDTAVGDGKLKEIIQNCLEEDLDNNFLALDEVNYVLLLDLNQYSAKELEQIPEKIMASLREHFKDPAHIGVGLPVETLKDIPKSYREASLALTVGKIFEDEAGIMRYNRLGLGRLIYQLPPTLCQMFLSEVFAPNTYEELDEETLLTIQKFFENNLNGSETSRQLFVHRNTLVYRLDKVQKITGLDLRNFDDAVLFKLASMVRKYLESLQRQEQTMRPNW